METVPNNLMREVATLQYLCGLLTKQRGTKLTQHPLSPGHEGVRQIRPSKQNNSCKIVCDGGPLKYHCSSAVTVLGD